MSTVAETSLFCHSERSRDLDFVILSVVEIWILSFWAQRRICSNGPNTVILSVVETSLLFCHSERSEESVKSVTIAVCYLLYHFSMLWPGVFWLLFYRTRHPKKTAHGDPSLRSGWPNEVQDDRVRFRMIVETSGFCHSERSEESVAMGQILSFWA